MEVADLVTDPLGVDRMDFKDELKLESGLEDTSMEIMDVATDSLTVDELDIKPIVKLEPTLMGTACGEETMEGELETDPLAPDIKPLVIQDPDFKGIKPSFLHNLIPLEESWNTSHDLEKLHEQGDAIENKSTSSLTPQIKSKLVSLQFFICRDCEMEFTKKYLLKVHRTPKCESLRWFGPPYFGRIKNDRHLSSEDAGTTSEGLHVIGSGKTSDKLPGFNGSARAPFDFSNIQPYNPDLKPFKCPDSLSPSVYLASKPVNHTDPSGHLRWQSITRIVAGAIGLCLIMFTAGSSIATAGGVMVALSSASASSLIIGVWGVALDITGIVIGAMEDWIPEAYWYLVWILGLLAMGLAVICAGLGLRKVTRRKMFHYQPLPYIANFTGNKDFLVKNGESRLLMWHEINHNGKLIFGADQEITGDDVIRPVLKIIRYINENRTSITKIYIITGTHGDMLGLNWNVSRYRFNEELLERTFTYEDQSNWRRLNRPRQGSKRLLVRIVDVRFIDRNRFKQILDNERYHVILSYCFSRNEHALIESCNLPLITPYTSYYSEFVANNYINAESHMIDPQTIHDLELKEKLVEFMNLYEKHRRIMTVTKRFS